MKDGRFEFPNVTPGQYVIQVDRGRRNAATEGEFGTLPVSVDGADITDLVLQTSTGSSITGRVTFETFRGTQIAEAGPDRHLAGAHRSGSVAGRAGKR